MPAVSSILKILIIDDDADDRLLLTDMLSTDARRFRFIVDGVESGQAGLDALRTSKYDVVLLDYKLSDPDMTGIDILKKITSLHFNVPVIIITNLNDVSIQARAIEAGAAEFLEKGRFNSDTLERTCIYAIGLHEKATRNGSGPGVGVLMEQLVSLTRESVQANSAVAQETQEFRRELNTGIQQLSSQLLNHNTECQFGHKEVIQEVQSKNKPYWKWLLEWIVAHPWIAFMLLILMIGTVIMIITLAITFIGYLDIEKINALKDILGMVGEGARRLWIA